jgi:hypothetical protein
LLRPQDALGQEMPRGRAFPFKTVLSAGFLGNPAAACPKP